MKISVSRTGSYIPKWHGNRDLPEGEQAICEYDHLPWEVRRKFITKDKTKLIIDDVETKADGELDREIMAQHSKFELTFQTDDEGITAAMKPRFKNLEDESGDVIDTWAKLLKVPVTPENEVDKLITEIVQHCSNEAKEKDLKN